MVVQLPQDQSELLQKGFTSLSYFPQQNEICYYESLFQYADIRNSGTEISYRDAMPFLFLSNLPKHNIDIIWKMADTDRSNTLNHSKFYIVVRCIQLFQNNIAIKSLVLTVDNDVVLEPAFFSGVSGVKVPLPSEINTAADIPNLIVVTRCERRPTPVPSEIDDSLVYGVEEGKVFRPIEDDKDVEEDPTYKQQYCQHHCHCMCGKVKKRQDGMESELATMRSLMMDNLTVMEEMMQELKALRELVGSQKACTAISKNSEVNYVKQKIKTQQLLDVHDITSKSSLSGTTKLEVDFPMTSNIDMATTKNDYNNSCYFDDEVSDMEMPFVCGGSGPKHVIKERILNPLTSRFRRSWTRNTSRMSTASIESEDSRFEQMQLKGICSSETEKEIPCKRWNLGVFGWGKKLDGNASGYCYGRQSFEDGVADSRMMSKAPAGKYEAASRDVTLEVAGNQISSRTKALKMNVIPIDNDKVPMLADCPVRPLTSSLKQGENLVSNISSNPAA